MSAESISPDILVREYTRELHSKNAAVFAGAGLSMASGYVDWKGLLSEIIVDLGLDPDKEHDLVTIAQYHCNEAGGNKGHLTQTIFNHFALAKSPTPAHRILASLPIFTYWTTNYDKLIEKALEEAKKVSDVKYTPKHLSVTRPDRDVVVYKMHGDIDHPTDAIITKDDFEEYPLSMAAFVSALRGDLVEKTFLFLGFSFTDPNIDFILSRVRVQYEKHQRPHYCVQKRVSMNSDETVEEFKYRELKQNYFIRDLKRFSVHTVLVDKYSEVAELLARIAANHRRSSIFISGAAEEYGDWKQSEAEDFTHKLSHQIAARKNRIITGFGVGVGGAVINGVLAYLNEIGKTISDEDLVMRPFPQVATGTTGLDEQWSSYRSAMLAHAGIAVFVFGNKCDSTGNIVVSDGMLEEFELCVERGVHPIPIGATGFMAKELWGEMVKDLSKFYPDATSSFIEDYQLLGDTSKSPDEIRRIVQRIIDHLQKA